MAAVTVFTVKILTDQDERFEAADKFRHESNCVIVTVNFFGSFERSGIYIIEITVYGDVANTDSPETVKLLMFPYVGTIPVIGIIGYLNLETKLAGIIRYDSAEEKLFIVRVG